MNPYEPPSTDVQWPHILPLTVQILLWPVALAVVCVVALLVVKELCILAIECVLAEVKHERARRSEGD